MRIRTHRLLVVSIAVVAAIASTHCAPSPPPERRPLAIDADRVVTVVHGALGCLFELKIEGVAEDDAKRVAAQATAEIDRVEDALGGWRDDTDLAHLNRDAFGKPFAASTLLFDAITRAIELTRATDGAFDVTVAPLVDAYGFRRGSPRVPEAAEIERLRAFVGTDHLKIDASARTIAFDRDGVKIDLDGLNKGIAVDRVMTLLREAGVTDASVSAGGSTIGSIGPPPGQPPREVAIEGPDGETHARVELRDQVLSTSGNWRHNIVVDGKEYGSIFDPRTGEPVAGDVLSSTVVAPRGDESEAFAKVGVVQGPRGAAKLAEARSDLKIVLLMRESEESARVIVAEFP